MGVLVAAKEGAWMLRPTRAPEKVTMMMVVVVMKDPADLLIFTEYADFCLYRCWS